MDERVECKSRHTGTLPAAAATAAYRSVKRYCKTKSKLSALIRSSSMTGFARAVSLNNLPVANVAGVEE